MQPDQPRSSTLAWTIPQRKTLSGLLALVFLLQIMALRPGHDWGGDFAQYLAHAKNIAQASSYAQTGYIYHADAPEIGPRAYPPVFPLFLAPLVGLYGTDMAVLKVAMLVLFVATLAITAQLFRRTLLAWSTIAATATLGFCPVFWEFNQQILSEHLFLLWWMLVFLVYEVARQDPLSRQRETAWGVGLGVLMFLAIGTRTVGIVLPLAVLVCETIGFRRLTRFALSSVATTAVCWLLMQLLLGSTGSGYLDQLSRISVQTIAFNLYADLASFSYVWRNGHWEWLREAAGVVFLLVAAAGFIRANLPRPQLLGVASVLYFVLVVIWPSAAWTRMIWPLLPGFVLWIFYAGEQFLPSAKAQRAGVALFLVFTFGSYATWYAQADYGPIPGPEDPAAQELFQEVKQRGGEHDVFLFFKPRVLAYYADSRAVGFPTYITPETVIETIRRHHVTFVVLRKEVPEADLQVVLSQQGFEEVWSNTQFQLWQQQR